MCTRPWPLGFRPVLGCQHLPIDSTTHSSYIQCAFYESFSCNLRSGDTQWHICSVCSIFFSIPTIKINCYLIHVCKTLAIVLAVMYWPRMHAFQQQPRPSGCTKETTKKMNGCENTSSKKKLNYRYFFLTACIWKIFCKCLEIYNHRNN